jgi:hypothetical protein
MQKNLTAQPTKTQFSALLKELQHHGGSEVEVDLP